MEEIYCARAHLQIKKIYKNVLTIIIPRHIDRIKKIKSDLQNLGLKITLYNKCHELDENTDILLIDSYGESLKFYNISKYVFCGKSLLKSLVKDGGQNPIEPARLGCKIFHGTYISNFTEIYKFLESLNVTKKIKDFNELSLSLVEEFKQDRDKNDEISKKIQNYGQNIFNNVIIELKKYI
jgi:3-deoxy-D-manno-octulosonic-acid transferase